MVEMIVIALLAIVVVFYTLKVAKKLTYSKSPFGFTGKLKFLDEGKQRGFAFVNTKFKVGATPDAIYETGLFTDTVVEVKARNGRVYDSDIAQAKAGVLAIAHNPKFSTVKHVVVSTNKETVKISVKSPSAIYRELKPLIKIAEKILNGQEVLDTKPQYHKCRSCRHFNRCNPPL